MPTRQPDHRKHLPDLQGGVIGFNKDFVRLLFFDFVDLASGKACLQELIPQLATGKEVLDFNAAFKRITQRGGNAGNEIQATWTNLWLTRKGLEKLGVPGVGDLPAEFREGMGARSAGLGDESKSAPAGWDAPFTGGAEPDAALYLAADRADDLEVRIADMTTILVAHGISVMAQQEGHSLAGPHRGREHFGFKDGVSQPGIAGFTRSSKGDAIPAGDVLIGYADSTGAISGEAPPVPPIVQPTGYNPMPTPPPTAALPPWLNNASFVVYRKLQQDVGGFKNSMAQAAPTLGLSVEQLAAKSVGRWPSGAPLERVSGMPKGIDPSTADPATAYPDVLKDAKINRFTYAKDTDGSHTPHAAHIRKSNPRSEALPDGDKASLHRMVRRGIPYGTEFVEGEPVYGGGPIDPSQDRGLLFITYQASIERSFEFVQRNWINRPDFPEAGDGLDPIASQRPESERPFRVQPASTSFSAWVFTRGGAYFASLSISQLKVLTSSQ